MHKGVEERTLNRCIRRQWFGQAGNKVRKVRVQDSIALGSGRGVSPGPCSWSWHTATAPPDMLLLPLSLATGEVGGQAWSRTPRAACWRASISTETRGLLYDGLQDDHLPPPALGVHHPEAQAQGAVRRDDLAPGQKPAATPAGAAGQRCPQLLALHRPPMYHTAVTYDQNLFLKLYRPLQAGVNPELELAQYLTEQAPRRIRAPAMPEPWNTGARTGNPTPWGILKGVRVRCGGRLQPRRGAGRTQPRADPHRRGSSRRRTGTWGPLYAVELPEPSRKFQGSLGGFYLDMVRSLGAPQRGPST